MLYIRYFFRQIRLHSSLFQISAKYIRVKMRVKYLVKTVLFMNEIRKAEIKLIVKNIFHTQKVNKKNIFPLPPG